MAEREGFEPSVRLWRTHTFQACSLNRSDTSPMFACRLAPVPVFHGVAHRLRLTPACTPLCKRSPGRRHFLSVFVNFRLAPGAPTNPHFRVRAFSGANTCCAAPAHPALAAFVRPCTANVFATSPLRPLGHFSENCRTLYL